jgi:hypothetical protein
VLGLTLEGELIVPLILDHTVWSRPAEDFAERVGEARDELGASVVRLLVSGTLSDRARAEFQRRGIDVTEHAFDALAPRVAEAMP